MIVTIRIPSGTDRVAVVGPSERNGKVLREPLGLSIHARDGLIRANGDGESSAPHSQERCDTPNPGIAMDIPSKDQHDSRSDKTDILSNANNLKDL